MQKIYFTVFSQAYYVDMNWGFGCPSGGIRRMGDIFHNYNIPITWLVSPRSARCEQEMFKDFHEKYGDEIAMMIRFKGTHHVSERKIAESLSKEAYINLIREQKAEIQKYLPWAQIRVAAQGIRTNNMLQALKEEGFIGVHGHCYCQIGTDSITDYGSPWGSFRIREGDYHLPARENEDGLIAFEWTQRDLNRSFHTVYPELWSTDPNDVERGGVCTDENVEWWKNMFMQYERALKLNEKGIWFQFHQESHEMTWGEVCKPFTEERVIFTADMMDEFLEWLVERDTVEFLTASDAAELYNKLNPKGTIPMYFPFAWTSVPKEMPFWEQIKNKKGYAGSLSKHSYIPQGELYSYLNDVLSADPMKAMESPPWKDSFFYYDDQCQLIFDLNRAHPVAIFNYLNYQVPQDLKEEGAFKDIGGGAIGYYLEPHVPGPSIIDIANDLSVTEKENTIKIDWSKTEHELPYGLFLWNTKFKGIDEVFSNPELAKKLHLVLENKDSKNSVAAKNGYSSPKYKVSPGQGVFIRFNLTPGENVLRFKFS
ncbi:MAG: hypothetical protein ACTSU2_12235 [Promethearchaeota archaeon]